MNKIAVITVTYNDGYKVKEWYEHYQEYKDDIYLHIIVDNGSTGDYIAQVRDKFVNSHVVELGYNGGSTAAYNAGIKYALSKPEIDSIALVGNDIKLPVKSLNVLYSFLYSDQSYGMVAPVLLKRNNSIDCYGEILNRHNMNLIVLNKNKQLDEVPETYISDTLPGGCNLAKREFYEKVGLQDENFFMYADEVDMGIRGERAGFKFASTTRAKSWHMHINQPGAVNRNPMAAYLMGRNHIYLAKKLFGRKEVFCTICHRLWGSCMFFLSCIKHRKSKEEYKYAMFFAKGVFAGIRGDMKNDF